MHYQRYPTASLMHRSVRKLKEMDAGATSRALPMGNRLPLKAWQGKTTKMSPVGESVAFLFFFLKPFCFFNHPLSTLSDNRKKLYSYSLFHPDSIYSSNNNISYSENCISTFIFRISRRQPFSTIQKEKVKKPIKEENWSQKPAKNLPLLLLIYQQLTCSEYRFKQKLSLKILSRFSFMKQFLTVPSKELPLLYIFFPIDLYFTIIKKGYICISIMLS